MSEEIALTMAEAADRLAIRQLIDAYAHCADRRDAAGQMSLFTEDTRFLVFLDPASPTPSQEILSRAGLEPVFADLNAYRATTHFNGQSTVQLNGDHGSGETYCLAHHVSEGDGPATLMVASIRYLDQFVRADGVWRFAERKLYVDWIETRPLAV
jgi:ketosteroid isomerase-like protein